MRDPIRSEPIPENLPEKGRSIAVRRSLVPIFVLIALLVTVGVIVGFALSMKDATVREDLRARRQNATAADLDRLRSEDPAEKLAAIQEFADSKSVRAIRPLLEVTVRDDPPADTEAQKAIRGMGPLALKPLLDVILDLDSVEQGTEEWEFLDHMRVNAGKTFELIAEDLPEETAAFLLSRYEFDEDFEGDEMMYFEQVLGLVLKRAKLRSTDPLVSILRSKNVSVRRALLNLLGYIAAESSNALPLLVVCLRDEDEQIRTRAASFVGEVGAKSGAARQALVRLFGDPSAEVRATAITAIDRFDKRGKDFVPELVRALDDEDANVVQAAATALARFEPERLVEALKHETVDVRYAALVTLSDLEYEDAVDEMLEMARSDKDAELRPIALQAIGQMKSHARAAILDLVKIFETKDKGSRRLRLAACAALGQIAREKDTVIPVLRRALSDDSAEIRQTAVLALGSFGTDAEAALDDYFRLIEDPDVADAARDALVPFGKRVVERFEGLLLDESAGVRAIAVKALYEIGEDAATAVPAIAKCLTDEEDEVSRLAAEALGALAGKAEEPARKQAVDALIASLENESWEIRFKSALSLTSIDPEAAAAATPVLKALLEPKDLGGGLRLAILDAAATIGKPAVPVLVQALDDDIPQVQLDAIRKITQMGRNAEEAGEALRKVRTRSDNEQLREEAKKALKALREAPPAPEEADIDDIDDIERAFDDALEEI